MLTHKPILPITNKEILALDWKLNKQKSAYQNLTDVINAVKHQISEIHGDKLPVETHIQTKEKLKDALEEMNQNFVSLSALETALSPKLAELSKTLETKSREELTRELLVLNQNESRLKTSSPDFDYAYVEIEGEYFAKMSLYQMEIFRRETAA